MKHFVYPIRSKLTFITRSCFCQVWNSHKVFEEATPDFSYVSFVKGTDRTIELPNKFPVAVWNDFITTAEENKLVETLDPPLQKHPYSSSHFDSVICNFREQLLSHSKINKDPLLSEITNRVQQQICAEGTQLEDIHVLDIAEDGFIAPHVDTDFTGGIVAGLTLLSDAVITFQPHNPKLQETLLEKEGTEISGKTKLSLNKTIVFPELPRIDLLVPARSLYILTKEARYHWTHAIEVQENHKFKGNYVRRSRRISLMFRDAIPPSYAL